MEILVLTADDVRRCLPMAEAIEAMKQAYRQLSAGRAAMPLRGRIDVGDGDGTALFMPAYLHETGELAVKIVSVFPDNPPRGLDLIQAVVVALDPTTGAPAALLEGSTLTAIRTGAGSGAATDLLARRDARVVAIIGTGVQARTQLEAVCTVRPIKQVRVYSPDRRHAQAFAGEMAGRGPIPQSIRVTDSANEAVAQADVVCTATTSSTPVFDGSRLWPGTHINAVGSYTPEMQEVDAQTVRRARVVVDSREAALAEAGDLIVPIRQGVITEEHIHAEVGEIVAGTKPGRTSPDEITLFKSVGVAVQDAAAAGLAVRKARELGLGQRVVL
jgi:ornithine cyclodeaminase